VSDEFWFKAIYSDYFRQNRLPLHLAIYGDLGVLNGANGTHTVNRIRQETEAGKYDMIIHVGDFAYDLQDDSARVGDQFLRDIQPFAARLPYQTCPGNHEADFLASFANYKQRFTMPGDNENMYFSFDVGFVHFVAFSSEHYFQVPEEIYIGEQYAWLERDLTKANQNRKNVPWIILYGHRPMYCSDINKKKDFQIVRQIQQH